MRLPFQARSIVRSLNALVLVACALMLVGKAQRKSADNTNNGTGIVAGKVKLAGTRTHSDVLVRLTTTRKGAEPRETKTNEKGEFEFTGLMTGAYALSFEKSGYQTFTTRQLEVISGETLRIRSTVEMAKESAPYAVIRGAVLYGVGYSLPNAQVILERIDGEKKFKQEMVSQDGGEFAFRLRADKAKYRVTASARGFQSATQEIEIERDEIRSIALTLQPIQ